MYRKAIKCIFSELINKNRMTVIDNFVINRTRTKDIILKWNKIHYLLIQLLVAFSFICIIKPKYHGQSSVV